MREIKFRAWDVDRKKMCDVHNLAFHADYIYKAITIEQELGLYSTFVSIEKFELMQYTGLKDKNGVEIFEGDIVSLCWSDEVGESHWGKVTIKNPFEYTPEEARYFIHSDELEIIGNIYENNDLI